MKQSLLTILRDKQTPLEDFRRAAYQLGRLLAYDIALHLKEQSIPIETPFAPTTGYSLAENILCVPILRSGVALLTPFLETFEKATVGFLGIRRDEKTANPISYYAKLPQISPSDTICILDPMIATGGTSILAIEKLLEQGALESQIHFIALVAAEASLNKLKKTYAKVTFHVVAPHESLSDDFWITPGLGDFGDRFFGTPKNA